MSDALDRQPDRLERAVEVLLLADDHGDELVGVRPGARGGQHARSRSRSASALLVALAGSPAGSRPPRSTPARNGSRRRLLEVEHERVLAPRCCATAQLSVGERLVTRDAPHLRRAPGRAPSSPSRSRVSEYAKNTPGRRKPSPATGAGGVGEPALGADLVDEPRLESAAERRARYTSIVGVVGVVGAETRCACSTMPLCVTSSLGANTRRRLLSAARGGARGQRQRLAPFHRRRTSPSAAAACPRA